MIQEVIVVEGKDDIEAVKRAVDCVCIATHGHGFGQKLLVLLQELQERQGLIILTDPDYAGERIRARIREAVPQAKHAYLDQKEARRRGDVGVENASEEMIQEALQKAHATVVDASFTFTMDDLWRHGLVGSPASKAKRIALGKALGIGYANGKQLLARLNGFGITREEFENALKEESI